MSQQDEVDTAFDIVLEEIENAIEGLNQQGAAVLRKGDYEQARELIEKGSQMTSLRGRIDELRKEWDAIFGSVTVRPRRRRKSRKAAKGLERGLRTPADAFRAPLLQVLVQLGGSASVGSTLDAVGELMKAQLNDYDRSPLPSMPNSPRWRNTAQWARLGLVQEGLLASDSPRGTWEITDQGRRWLSEKAGES